MAATSSSTSVDTRGAEGPAGEVAVAAAKIHDVSAGQVSVQEWLDAFARALTSADESAIERLFLPNGYWRDILALHWDLRTFAGCANIAKAWGGALKRHRVSGIRLEEDKVAAFERRNWGKTVEALFDFETETAHCRGHLRLLAPAESKGAWNGWTLFTSLESLKGHEERAGQHRIRSTRGHDAPAADAGGGNAGADPQVLVIGAGQAGLAVAARLKQFELDTVVIDREKRVGDNWRNRYQSLLLHNQIWANHLPYLPFPASWPAYLSKDEMADWLEAYAKVLGLDIWLETRVVDAAYDEDKRRWTVRLARSDGTMTELHPRHVVQATGVFGVPNRPTIRGADRFEGKLIHAEDYEGGIAAPGVRVLVVGAGSSAHDVAQDLCKLGADVTMLQRSSTCVVSVEPGAAGKIKIKQGASIDRLEGKSVKFSDGTSMYVDVVVVAAGYTNMSESVRLVMGDKVADRVGPIWGLDDEGEVRAMWRPTGQPGFWLMGGSLQQCRHYSKCLALQIKADLVGLVSGQA